MLPSADLLNFLMEQALDEARQAKAEGEVPIGAVLAMPVVERPLVEQERSSNLPESIFHQNGIGFEVIARAHNRVERQRDATAHAEIEVLKKASSVLGKWRLGEAILCVTLEPCVMCVGAIRLARVGCVAFGASDSRMGGMGTVADFAMESRLGPAPEVVKGVREEECRSLLKEFFKELRR